MLAKKDISCESCSCDIVHLRMFINLHLQKLKTKINPDTDNVPHTNRSSIPARFLNKNIFGGGVRHDVLTVEVNSMKN